MAKFLCDNRVRLIYSNYYVPAIEHASVGNGPQELLSLLPPACKNARLASNFLICHYKAWPPSNFFKIIEAMPGPAKIQMSIRPLDLRLQNMFRPYLVLTFIHHLRGICNLSLC